MIRVKATTETAPTYPNHRISAKPGRQTETPSIRARGRRGESLASARDRQRLRERRSAERVRVEGMLASVAAPTERRVRDRNSASEDAISHARRSRLRAFPATGCPVCGDDRTVTDEVMYGGTLRMSECLHCDHRWTERPKGHWVELGARMNRDWRPRAFSMGER